MAKQVHNVKVELGRSIRIENIRPKARETKFYYAIQVHPHNNDTGECLLFTEKELDKCPVVDITWDLECGVLYPYTEGCFDGYLVKTLEYGAKYDEWFIVVRKITKRKIERARKRMKNNPEDATVIENNTVLSALKWIFSTKK